MNERYTDQIVDSNGSTYPFSLAVSSGGKTGELVWPPETSKLETILRTSETSLRTTIVWTTMKIRCLINAQVGDIGTDLKIVFAMTPYPYKIADGGRFLDFLRGLKLPEASRSEDTESEQCAPPGFDLSPNHPFSAVQRSNQCAEQVLVEDRGIPEYAYNFLVNRAETEAAVTIINSWTYEGQVRTQTRHYTIAPGEEKEVFSFPRAQSPNCRITHCSLG